jgi:hypothetical protein
VIPDLILKTSLRGHPKKPVICPIKMFKTLNAILVAALFASLGLVAARAETVLQVKTVSPFSETGGDDLVRLKDLALNVGYEFSPNAETNLKLKELGIKYLRCINVDPLNGHYAPDGSFVVEPGGTTARLDAHLKACREIGANPHICFNIQVPEDLRISNESVKKDLGLMGQQTGSIKFWNGDWAKFKAHTKAYFDYVVCQNGFTNARFEVGNEPELCGQGFMLPGPKQGFGTERLYQEYFNVYKHTAEAAVEFEREKHVKITLGGPASAWAYSFRLAKFNWTDRFMQDCSAQKVKVDFIGLHYYGNISSLSGGYKANFPSFVEMLEQSKKSRDRLLPGVPILFTEWGPSYVTENKSSAVVNADNVGAAWSMEFISLMLERGVAEAVYLITTDNSQPDTAHSKKRQDVWGWPALFLNPELFGGKVIPKPAYQVFNLISKLEGGRVESTRSGKVRSFAVVDRNTKSVRVLVWNYHAKIPEKGKAVEMGAAENVQLRISDAKQIFGDLAQVKMIRSLVSKEVGSDGLKVAKGEMRPENFKGSTLVKAETMNVIGDELECSFTLPPSSVSLVEFLK